MKLRSSNTIVLVLTTLFFTGALYGQSSFDLLPPRQADLNTEQVRMSPDPDAIPRYQFAVAAINGDKVEIFTTTTEQKLLARMPNATPAKAPQGHVFYTENVTQNYTVSVPYTEDVDGKKITRIRTETRTRTVPVRRTRKMNEKELAAEKEKAKEEPEKEKDKKEEVAEQKPVATQVPVQIPYTINVPYTEVDDDGNQIQRFREEKRTRTAMVVRGKTETTSKSSKSSYKLDKIQCFNVSGTAVDMETLQAKAKEEERVPVILIQSKDHIDPYFELILKPETLFVVIDKNKDKKDKEEKEKDEDKDQVR